ncbi:MAG: GGDEF-domain containing protein [Gammaproteobacteria bacterium]|nr:MAG: GGDEF-domain containing protein [Gammaproteobacteria bacterium]RKZ96410.1 MAG: GGDEF-domain containing protein [Gammaproteobacteria bacterium]
MEQAAGSTQLLLNVNALKGQASKTAYLGAIIAFASIIIATLLVSYFATGSITLSGIVEAQRTNFGLWILDALPLVFTFWGQYAGSIIAYQAGAMILDQTNELRNKTASLEKQAIYSSTHDPLTDFPNRSLFYDRVEQAILSANNQGKTLSVLLFEIENYKEIYGTLGRNNSDLILKQVASRLQGAVKNYDNIARLEGGTFSLLINDEQENVIHVSNNIQESMQAAFIVERQQVAVHTCTGIVKFPDHGEDVDTLVQRAGIALYIARNSKEGSAVYDPSFDEHSPHRLTLMSELRHAINRNEFTLFYQAKVSLKTNSIYGVEALIRWVHPKHGLVSPDEFIPMAERTRTIQQVTRWVLRQAFEDCAKWHQEGLDIKVSVNLSTKDFHDPELPDFIGGIQAATQIKPEWILLEITEGSIMTDPEQAMEMIQRLHGMGYEFSIDDYGTGYSSLAYLKKLPLAELKIDRSFVQDITHSLNDAVIVNATINLAQNLGLQIVAEGVEDEEIMAQLKDYGCDIAQGFYINKPQPVEEFNTWLKESQWHT